MAGSKSRVMFAEIMSVCIGTKGILNDCGSAMRRNDHVQSSNAWLAGR